MKLGMIGSGLGLEFFLIRDLEFVLNFFLVH